MMNVVWDENGIAVMDGETVVAEWSSFSVSADGATVTINAYANGNHKEFFEARIADPAAVKKAIEDAEAFSNGGWREFCERDEF